MILFHFLNKGKCIRNLKYTITYQYGLKDGYELWYYDNGIKQSEVLYKQDIIIADIIRWDENGNLIYK